MSVSGYHIWRHVITICYPPLKSLTNFDSGIILDLQKCFKDSTRVRKYSPPRTKKLTPILYYSINCRLTHLYFTRFSTVSSVSGASTVQHVTFSHHVTFNLHGSASVFPCFSQLGQLWGVPVKYVVAYPIVWVYLFVVCLLFLVLILITWLKCSIFLLHYYYFSLLPAKNL